MINTDKLAYNVMQIGVFWQSVLFRHDYFSSSNTLLTDLLFLESEYILLNLP
jgi:hypothetical protein